MSFLMAIVVLMATMSFSVDMHFCGNTIIDYSFVQQAAGCGMETAITADCEYPTISEKPCCTNKQLMKQGDNDLKVSLDQLSFDQQVFAASFIYSYSNLFESAAYDNAAFVDLSPPFIERDVQVLHQTFLI